MPVNSLPPTRSQADVSLASTMPTPVPPEKKFSSHVYDELKNLDNLLAYLEESPHKNGYLRYSEDTGWKFSPNKSWRDSLHMRDAGFSKAPINPADMGLVKPGEEIALCNLLQRLNTKINSYPVTLESFEKTPFTPPVAEPVKPTPLPRRIFPNATPTKTPIPSPRLVLQKHQKEMNKHIDSPASSSAPVEVDKLSVKERAKEWECRN
ncbi:hypothetical protein [Pseudomonas grimontii]|uniref:hypothetical protein n=1 Tax=Pseudomonas grimontii TaxID=129847 RepID=UPI0028E98173|nr:hypothetical protein [Pseudomonas grimontii]